MLLFSKNLIISLKLTTTLTLMLTLTQTLALTLTLTLTMIYLVGTYRCDHPSFVRGFANSQVVKLGLGLLYSMILGIGLARVRVGLGFSIRVKVHLKHLGLRFKFDIFKSAER